MNRMILCAALMAATAPAWADVSVTTQTSGKASFLNVGGEGVSQIKGKRMRSDQTVGSKTVSLITDIDNMRFVDINDAKKSATVTPLASIADELQKVGVGAMDATLNKTSQTKTIAGYPCTVHDVKLAMPFSPTGQPGQGMDATMVLSGS